MRAANDGSHPIRYHQAGAGTDWCNRQRSPGGLQHLPQTLNSDAAPRPWRGSTHGTLESACTSSSAAVQRDDTGVKGSSGTFACPKDRPGRLAACRRRAAPAAAMNLKRTGSRGRAAMAESRIRVTYHAMPPGCFPGRRRLSVLRKNRESAGQSRLRDFPAVVGRATLAWVGPRDLSV